MTQEQVENLEARRCAAMLASDVAALDQLFSDELRWAHASGAVDTKAGMMAQFADGSMRCLSIERRDTHTSIFGNAAVVTGTVEMDAVVNHVRKQVRSRYAGVWSSHEGEPRLVNWQSARLG